MSCPVVIKYTYIALKSRRFRHSPGKFSFRRDSARLGTRVAHSVTLPHRKHDAFFVVDRIIE